MFLFISVFQYFSAFVGKHWVNQFLANVPILHPLKTLARNDLTQCFPVFCNKYRIILETISNNWENLQEMGKLILAKLLTKNYINNFTVKLFCGKLWTGLFSYGYCWWEFENEWLRFMVFHLPFICSKLTMETPKQRVKCVKVNNREIRTLSLKSQKSRTSQIVMMFPLLTLNK